MSLWLLLLILLVLASAFVAWPLWRYRKPIASGVDDAGVSLRLAENVRVFREHLRELDNNLAANTIDAAQYAQLKLELERNLLEDEASLQVGHKKSAFRFGASGAVIFCALLFVSGVVFYSHKGGAPDVAIRGLVQNKMQQDYQDMLSNKESNPVLNQQLISAFKARLQDKPDNEQYWYLLARAQMEAANFAEAANAYQEVLKRDPQSPLVMAELAQAMFLRDGNQMTPAATEMAKGSLTLDSRNTMALGLLGIEAFGRQDYPVAIRYWQRSVDLLGADSQGGKALASGIEQAKTRFVAAGGKLEDLNTQSPYAVTVMVSLGTKAKVKPDDIVFVYARAWKGMPMPLAISRFKASELPKQVVLDETMAMSPAASLATASDVEVIARVSPGGSAQAQAGDWQAKQGPISMKSIPKVISLEISEQLTAESLSAQ